MTADASRRDAGRRVGAVRALFVGNSYTYFNNLPALVSRLVEARGTSLESDAVVAGGMTLIGHLRQGRATAKIREGGWDAVVLQEQSTRPIEAPALMERAVGRFREEIMRTGAETLLFLTWVPRDHPERQSRIDEAYAVIARRTGARVAAAGPAWWRALAERPELPLYGPDGAHPAPAGTYLAACVIAALIGGRPIDSDVRTVDATDGGLSTTVTLAVEEARYYQRVANETVASWSGPDEDGAGLAPSEDGDEDFALLRESPFLRGLTVAQAQTVLDIVRREKVPAETELFRAGDHGTTAYVLLAGEVAITGADEEPWECDVAELGKVMTAGAESLLGHPYRTSVRTKTSADALVVRSADLDLLARRDSTAAETIRANLAAD